MITKFHYEAALFRAGKRVGTIFEFDSLPQAQDYCLNTRTPNGGLYGHPIALVDLNSPPDESWEGFVIRPVKTLHRPGDPVGGVRTYC